MIDLREPAVKLMKTAGDAESALFVSLGNMTIPDITIMNLINWVAAGAMIIGGVFPFIPQYLDIRKTGNSEGFSTFVCLNLLIANTLRILFWFGKHYELPLLVQSIIMIVTMLALVHVCVAAKHKSEIISSKVRKFSDSSVPHSSLNSSSHNHQTDSTESSFLDFDTQYFWKWTDFSSYIQFMLAFSTVMGLITFILINFWLYVETIGFLAVFAEAMLGAPQFYRNYQNQSTQGMSKKMVAMWTCGDVFKTVYFILRETPAQFWICGILQVSIDISIFMQVYMYRNLPPRKLVKQHLMAE
ncbi:hypothetical protein ACJMK2_010011 [Sinanodonta woodiana]|uniref:Solute carrier family 66 member 2 n=1 Tax=Sinanodonta woodiana TaxID=1069815 RepID=A0ABD3VFM1_SINWO